MKENFPNAVIFDMDGLMLESEGVWSEVDKQVVSFYGKEFDTGLKHLFMGCERLESARRFCEAYGIPAPPEEVADRRSQLVAGHYAKDVKLMPGLEELIGMLETMGMPLAVATSAECSIVNIVKSRFDIFNKFKAIVCADEVENGKPSPDLYLEAAKRLGIAPGLCLVFEDSPNGIFAALAAGMKVIGVPNPHVDISKMSRASGLVEKLSDISVDYIKKIFNNQG